MLIRHPKPQMGTEKETLFHRRIIAYFIDAIIFVILAGVIGIIAFPYYLKIGKIPPWHLFVGILIEFLYYVFLEGFMGQTIGKKLMKIVVVKEDGSPCTYKVAFIRNLLRIIDAQIPLGNTPTYLIGGIIALLTNRRQRIGDLIAKTIVVKVAPENKDERNP